VPEKLPQGLTVEKRFVPGPDVITPGLVRRPLHCTGGRPGNTPGCGEILQGSRYQALAVTPQRSDDKGTVTTREIETIRS
jgi:hypothetical protein